MMRPLLLLLTRLGAVRGCTCGEVAPNSVDSYPYCCAYSDSENVGKCMGGSSYCTGSSTTLNTMCGSYLTNSGVEQVNTPCTADSPDARQTRGIMFS